MKTLLLSFLAMLPAANTVETPLFTARRRANYGAQLTQVRSCIKIICDPQDSYANDLHDEVGHHRYYGRAARV